MRRAALLLVVLAALAVPAPAVLAQGDNPFGPLPPPVPQPTPEPERPEDPDAGTDPMVMLLIAVGAVVVFVGMGVYITRDARRSLTDSDRRALDRRLDPDAPGRRLTPAERRERERAKQRARAKGRAQRQARKAARKR